MKPRPGPSALNELLFAIALLSAGACGALGVLLAAKASPEVRHFVLAFLGAPSP
jgi:hypothetical protein